MKARVSNLHKKEAEWDAISSWIPEAGELIVYDPDNNFNYARLKIGDGNRTLAQLDFFIQSTVDNTISSISFSELIDGGRIK